jgi:hypothetical protein
MPQTTIDCASYQVTDDFFGSPYIDADEWCQEPCPHRRVHGGFADCDTRFTFYFPRAEEWRGRLIQPLEGAHAGHEDFFGGGFGEAMGGVGLTVRLGGYMVESNMGHIGDDIDPRGGEDPTLYGWRAAVEAARFSKYVATQVYGEPPHHAYVWGGSGGGRRSPLVLENAPDVFDGALPFMGGGDVADFPATECTQGGQVMSFACMFNVQRLLRDKMGPLIDAMQPGGSGDPFAGLGSHEREELATLYRLGFPRGDEYMIAAPMGQIWLWSSIADQLVEQDPGYFEKFWSSPGYVGHDLPSAVRGDVIDTVATVERVVSVGDLVQDAEFAGPEYALMRNTAMLLSGASGLDLPVAVRLRDLPAGGYPLGAQLRPVGGEADGRVLYCTGEGGGLLTADGRGEANLLRFGGVRPGDRIHVDNRRFLAFCYFHRHHLMADPPFDALRVGGAPMYPQHPVPYMSPLMGVPYTGRYEGKLLWIHHTHDSSLWPPQGVIYADAVRKAQGEEGAERNFRLQWTEHAEHVPPQYLPGSAERSCETWLIDYFPIIEQGLADLIRWVEDGVPPAASNFEYAHGQVILPPAAVERGGVQPTAEVTANGGARTDVKTGDPVTLEVDVRAPAAGGTIIAVEWDFDGTGAFPYRHQVDGTRTALRLSTTHTYDRPGTYFATARVTSHREGEVGAQFRRLTNVASARIVVE